MAIHFEGEVEVRWLIESGDDRKMQLLSEFAFVDSSNFTWKASQGDIIDGASIPEIVWSSVVGTPFIGDYRRASVVHDVACQKKIKTSKEAHRMFYEAMLADGTSEMRALMFYTAVRLFGPQWDNATGPSNSEFKAAFASEPTKQRIEFEKLELALDAVLQKKNR